MNTFSLMNNKKINFKKIVDKTMVCGLPSGYLLNTGNPATAPVSIAVSLCPTFKGVSGWTGNILNTCRSWLRCVQHPGTLPNPLNRSNFMNNTPAVLRFESHEVRIINLDGGPLFVAADICAVLNVGNPSQALSRLDDDEKGIISNDTLGGKQNMTVVNESGLYSLILSSRKPEAKRFKKWVTSEVLPAIRKTGSYNQEPQSHTIPTGRYIELLEAENKFLRDSTTVTISDKPRTLAKNQLLDKTGINKMLYEKYLELHGEKSVMQWWRETDIPLCHETVTAALLRNHRKSAPTIGVIARALKFPSHDIRVMLLKLRHGEAAVLLT